MLDVRVILARYAFQTARYERLPVIDSRDHGDERMVQTTLSHYSFLPLSATNLVRRGRHLWAWYGH